MPNLALREYREAGYPSSEEGKRFYLTRQTPDDVVTGETSFDETTPTILISNGSDTRIIIRRVIVTNLSNKEVNVSAVLDEVDRFSAGGAGETPQNTNGGKSDTSGITVVVGATATASGAGTRVMRTDGVEAVMGGKVTLDFQDCVIVDVDGSFLLYIWDGQGMAGPDTYVFIDVEIEPVP